MRSAQSKPVKSCKKQMEFLKEEFNMGLQVFELLLDTRKRKSGSLKKKQTKKSASIPLHVSKVKKKKSLFSVTVPKI